MLDESITLSYTKMSRPIKKYFNSESGGVANKTKVVRGLLKELLEGKWNVAGRLTEAEACERFQISRTPVREALIELQGLGLLELRRNCGAIMQAFGPNELANIYSVRAMLEVRATRLAASNADAEDVDDLIQFFRENIDSKESHDRQFHDFISRTSGNMSMAAEISRFNNLVQTMREIMAEKVKIPVEYSVEEYLDILEVIKAGKPNEAAKAMQRHHDREAEVAIAAMKAFRALTV
jgi:DNA-binding GntR family transcriptional regulator